VSGYKLSFEGLKEKEGTIAIPLLVDKLQKLQNLNYLIGEYKENRPFKAASMGAKKKSTINEYTLVLSDIQKGSTVLEISTNGFQSSILTEDKVYAPKSKTCLGIIYRYAGIMNEDGIEKTMSEEIKDDGYRKKLFNLFYELAPGENDTYKIRFEDENNVSHYLTNKTRANLKNVVELTYDDEIERLYCPVVGNSTVSDADGIRSFNTFIDGKSMKVPFEFKFMEKIQRCFGKIIEIECKCKIDDDERIVKVTNVLSIEERNSMDLYELSCDDVSYEFVKPLTILVDSAKDNAEGYWTLRNDDLGIRYSALKWLDAYSGFCDYFDLLVKEYVESDEEMTPKARELGLKVKSYLRGC